MTRWLSADEQQQWRAWLTTNLLLPDALDRDLREHTGIGLGEYEILVHLSEAPDRRLRMADLAHCTLASRSRLTHQISRMQTAGWVTREQCSEDHRGQWAVLTDAGYALIVAAAPIHVDSVRRHLLDVLGPDDFATFGEMCERVARPLQRDLTSVSAPLAPE